jgi:hypothetical protein
MTVSGSKFSSSDTDPVLYPAPEAVATLGKLRMRELQAICDRLNRFPKWPYSRFWYATAAVLIGAAIGAVPGGSQLAPKADETLYWCLAGGAAALGIVCLIAGLTTQSERTESIEAIKEDLDLLLKPYDGSPPDEI